MSVTFFIPGSPVKEIFYPPDDHYPEGFRTTEDIWPSVQMSNSNAYHYVGTLADKCAGNDPAFPSFDSCGSWTPAQAEAMRCELAEHVYSQYIDPRDISRYMRMYSLLEFAVALDKTIDWG